MAYDQVVLVLGRMTWLGLIALAAAIAGLVAGWRLAVLAACGFLFMGVLGLWIPSIETLALILFAVIIALLIGIPVGIWAGRRPSIERVIRPVLDAMQTIPAFSYLVPVVLLFGIGVPTALIATVIFAIPPAIRLTGLGVRQVPETSLEVGRSFGSTSRQLLRRVQLPLAKPAILLGVNQTIMMALGIVVIAASVGVGGLGQVVLDGLNNLNVGLALAEGSPSWRWPSCSTARRRRGVSATGSGADRPRSACTGTRSPGSWRSSCRSRSSRSRSSSVGRSFANRSSRRRGPCRSRIP